MRRVLHTTRRRSPRVGRRRAPIDVERSLLKPTLVRSRRMKALRATFSLLASSPLPPPPGGWRKVDGRYSFRAYGTEIHGNPQLHATRTSCGRHRYCDFCLHWAHAHASTLFLSELVAQLRDERGLVNARSSGWRPGVSVPEHTPPYFDDQTARHYCELSVTSYLTISVAPRGRKCL
jgi:hypothetical protein